MTGAAICKGLIIFVVLGFVSYIILYPFLRIAKKADEEMEKAIREMRKNKRD